MVNAINWKGYVYPDCWCCHRRVDDYIFSLFSSKSKRKSDTYRSNNGLTPSTSNSWRSFAQLPMALFGIYREHSIQLQLFTYIFIFQQWIGAVAERKAQGASGTRNGQTSRMWRCAATRIARLEKSAVATKTGRTFFWNYLIRSRW